MKLQASSVTRFGVHFSFVAASTELALLAEGWMECLLVLLLARSRLNDLINEKGARL